MEIPFYDDGCTRCASEEICSKVKRIGLPVDPALSFLHPLEHARDRQKKQ
jgi:hypothetical protein